MGDDARRLILARRARFLAAAVTGIAVSACGGETTNDPEPCLKMVVDAGTDADDAEPMPCLGAPEPDAAVPGPCLTSPAPDGSS